MKGREILLGVTGGIAAYKAADLCSKLVQAEALVTVVLTESSQQFIGKTTFEALTNRAVYTDLFQPQEHHRGEHIGLARRAELCIVAPASASFLAKAAYGLADDLLSTLMLSLTCPLLIAPAMNTQMWNNPAVQRNLKQVIDNGAHCIEPESGWLSCREEGEGRMAAPETIFTEVQNHLPTRDG